ncbi:alpha N-terminal protein methyltransferase 1 [Calliphora vicina]|uniref:alpha N-terminal protein methyltransferase 1 n=1 Tax=Calliphora vicina TaxID=7373 RepID=UPI00325AAECB
MQEITSNEVANTQVSPEHGETQKPQKEFYTKAQQYWSEIPATVNGMLGGLGYISAIDVQGSNAFLRELKLKDANKKYALDCGAGIGRVTKNLLMPLFNKVDMVEQDPTFAEKAKDYCSTDSGSTLGYPNRLGEIYNMGLQQFVPAAQKYDLVWSQWVLGHLTDQDLLAFFRRIHDGLSAGGTFVLKENVTKTKEVVKDDEDSSVTRPLKDYERILKQAGFRIVKMTQQKSFPKGLFPVYMIACRPATSQ